MTKVATVILKFIRVMKILIDFSPNKINFNSLFIIVNKFKSQKIDFLFRLIKEISENTKNSL